MATGSASGNSAERDQAYLDGFDAAIEVANSLRSHVTWGPKATAQDGYEEGLATIKRVLQRAREEMGRHHDLPRIDAAPGGKVVIRKISVHYSAGIGTTWEYKLAFPWSAIDDEEFTVMRDECIRDGEGYAYKVGDEIEVELCN